LSSRSAVVQGHLGSLNPTPWAFMLGNTFGWVTYGILKDRNLFIFFANAPGFLMSVWLNLQATKLQYAESRNRLMDTTTERTSMNPTLDTEEAEAAAKPSTLTQERYVVFMVVIWMMLVSFICFADLSNQMDLRIIGTADNINLVFFYGAPLSTIYTVLKQRSAATIHVPTMLTNTANGSFWAAYGVAVLDPFIAVPNAIGALLGLIQIVLCLLFPRNPKTTTTTTTTSISNDKNNNEPHCHSTTELVEEDTC
jgi:solute carrier family 50 protein (sugar transporter)